jgi:predicted GH43/DUF377 family glycosyl hydrolase
MPKNIQLQIISSWSHREMKWRKLGLVWGPDGSQSWAKTHASGPTPIVFDSYVRVFVQSLDEHGIGRIGYVDLARDNLLKVIGSSKKPVIDIGKPGTFDENGVFPTSIIQHQEELYLYYVGFELGTKIRYRLLSGLAISTDGGESFYRSKNTPILERSNEELYFRCGPFVCKDNNRWRMWYVAGSEWINLNNKDLPAYDLRYIESDNGTDWPSVGKVVMPLDSSREHGFGRPYIVKEGGIYKMFYSIRCMERGAYKLGYAESPDGIEWTRKDQEIGLDISEEGWDSLSIEYSAFLNVDGKKYLFYNGNDFGADGFGIAVMDEEE